MKNKFYEIIKFPSFSGKTGTLTMLEHGKNPNSLVPFPIKRVFTIRGMKGEDERGGHTHHKTRQIIVCLRGSCRINLDDGKKKTFADLKDPSEGITLEPYIWHTISDFKGDPILMVLASTEYDERDYIRDYSQFLKLVSKTGNY